LLNLEVGVMLREEIWGFKLGIPKSSNMGHFHGESNWFKYV
jgi:hypothetical protein